MSIEIKELKIKINISDPQNRNNSNQLPKINSTEFKEMKQEIVNECIQKVLEKIKENSQR
ncbi:DUF5908 family protein [Chryseobacterium caseinilyticum]|uniref:Uncharacterized protein n=1 Tax=Chryseobacterium caseinilyticum TaxID=2771428 RepID=A0ABR8ZAP3_9FLAO|nr:DUF5908 family protein [Chryseobacterium caseinilyticum]MBD8082305.1 hypothetical protein [Chryseobacterium caseinilyticum]